MNGFCVPGCVFWLPRIRTISEGEILCPNNSQYWKDKIDNILLVVYTHSLGKGAITCYIRPHEGCTGSRMKQLGAVGDKICSNKRLGCPLVPAGRCAWLVWIISQASQEVKPIRLGTRWNVARLMRELAWLGSFLIGWDARLVRAGNSQINLWGPVRLKDIKAEIKL